MKGAFPVVLTTIDDGVLVEIPDFGIDTEGDSVVDAIEMARDAIGLTGIVLEDRNEPIPEASDIAAIQKELDDGDIVTLVDVDFAEYRKRNDFRTVRKNCTLPAWISYEADKAGLNCSALLQEALKRKLGMTAPGSFK